MKDGSVRHEKFITSKWKNACSVCKCSKSSTDLFFHALSVYTSLQVEYCTDRYHLVTPVDQLQMQLGVWFYSKWYYTWPGVGVLARKNSLALNLHSKQIPLLFQEVFLNKILLALSIAIFTREKRQNVWGALLIILTKNHRWSWGEFRYIKKIVRAFSCYVEYTYCKDGTEIKSLVLSPTYEKNNNFKHEKGKILKLFYKEQFVIDFKEQSGKCILSRSRCSKFRIFCWGGPPTKLGTLQVHLSTQWVHVPVYPNKLWVRHCNVYCISSHMYRQNKYL